MRFDSCEEILEDFSFLKSLIVALPEDNFPYMTKNEIQEEKVSWIEEIKKVKRNLKRQGQEAYDLVALGSGVVLVMEIETKLMSKWSVDRFVDKKLPRFKELFPEYQEYQLVGAMGALVVKDDAGRYAEKAGLYVLTQTDEGGATLLNRKGFEPKTFS
jgi:hypothetical protein